MRIVAPKLQRNFIGLDGFVWFVGVVEDRMDPLMLGRCKVRCFGWHPEDKKMVPTDQLPWALSTKQLDNGLSVVGPREGDWVLGFFRDGIVAQEPMMCAIVPGGREKEADPSKGFNDPRTELTNVPRDPISFPIQHDDGSGSELSNIRVKSNYPQNESEDPLLRYVDNKEVITNRLERNEFIDQSIVSIKKENVGVGQTDVPTATHPTSKIGTDETSEGIPWTEPTTPYVTKYPYNHAYWSESGHVIEVDDSPNGERLHWYHRSGTFKEIHPLGTVVEKIVDTEHHIVLKGRRTHIEADDEETVDWNKKVYINKDNKSGFNYDVTTGVGSDYNVTLKSGNHNKYVMDGDENTRISKNRNYLIENDQVGHVLVDRCVTVMSDDVLHIFGNGNVVIHEDSLVKVYGNSILTVDGNADIKVKGNSKTEIDGNAEIKVKGDSKFECNGSSYSTIYGDKFETILGSEYKLILKNQYTSVLVERLDAVGATQSRYTGGVLTESSTISIGIVSPILLLNDQVPIVLAEAAVTVPTMPIMPMLAIPILPTLPQETILSNVSEASLIKVKLPEQSG